MTANVLIVDDEVALSGFLKEVIEADGYVVRLASTLEAARRQLLEASPDVVLVNALLPDGNGHALCQDLRARPETSRLPLVFMSAMSRPVDIEKAMALGADAFLGKPFLARDLSRTLSRVTGRVTGPAGRDRRVTKDGNPATSPPSGDAPRPSANVGRMERLSLRLRIFLFFALIAARDPRGAPVRGDLCRQRRGG